MVTLEASGSADHSDAAPGPEYLIMLRPVLEIADMSSFYARAYVNLVQAAPPTAPADTLVAKVWAKYGHFYKIHLSVINCSQVNKQLYK